MTRASGDRIDSYEVLEVLGRGAFGVTYLVRDTTLDLRFALKEYFPAGLASRQADGAVTAQAGGRRCVPPWPAAVCCGG